MMEVKVLAFGIAREIMGSRSIQVEMGETLLVSELRNQLELRYPALRKIASYAVAVNDEYAQNSDTVKASDEIAIIPPVSGG